MWTFRGLVRTDIVAVRLSTCQATDRESQAERDLAPAGLGPTVPLTSWDNRSSPGILQEGMVRRNLSSQQTSRYRPDSLLSGRLDSGTSSGRRRAGFLCKPHMIPRGLSRSALDGKVSPASLIACRVRKAISRRGKSM